MKLAFFVNTPGQVHLYRNVVRILESHGHEVRILARDYIDTTTLLDEYGLDYFTYIGKSSVGRAKLATFPIDVMKAYRHLRTDKPDLLLGMGIYTPYVAELLRRPSVVFTDSEPTPIQFAMFKPFTDVIITPSTFRMNLGDRHLKVDSFKELAYLHPNYFKPNPSTLSDVGLKEDEEFALLRFNGFYAIHDIGIHGFSNEDKLRLVRLLERDLRVLISSERLLPPKLRQYEISIPKSKIHDLISYAKLIVADTQTMTTEAAILGTPAIRFNGFVGKNDMGNFLELEHKYGLIFNYRDVDSAISRAVEIARADGIKEEWKRKSAILMNDKIDLAKYLVDFVEGFGRGS